jgi:hypothetical protein
MIKSYSFFMLDVHLYMAVRGASWGGTFGGGKAPENNCHVAAKKTTE